MSEFIQDGTTAAYRAKVDNKNRLHTFATVETGGTEASIDGQLFNANSGTVNLTSANKSSLLYMKNTDGFNWVVNRVFYNAGVSTGGNGDFLAEVIANPTAGTLISAGTALTVHNLNFGSSNTLDSLALVGVEGSTLTDGVARVSTIIPAAGARVLIAFDSIVVPPAASIGIAITPQAGNTSMNIQVGLNIYKAAD